jgi:uncharacterized protein (DUF2164 family)
MYGISELTKEHRQQLAESVRTQLNAERMAAVEKNNADLVVEIDVKLSSLNEIYQLNEVEDDNSK